MVFTPLWFADSWVQGATAAPLVLAIWFVVYTVSFYSVALHAHYGQTFGKIVMGVKVVDVSETKLSIRQAILRDIVPIFFSVLSIASALPRIFSGLGPYKTAGELSWIDYGWASGSLIWFLLEVVTMLTNEKRRAVHDFIAGSVVVRLKYVDDQAKADGVAA